MFDFELLINEGVCFDGLFISTVLFTFWHYITNRVSFFQTLDWFIGGIMLFLIYWVTGSIWVATIVHFSRNFINIIFFDISSGYSIISYNKRMPPMRSLIQ